MHNKEQSMLELVLIVTLVGALGISPSIMGSLAMLHLIWSDSSSLTEVMESV